MSFSLIWSFRNRLPVLWKSIETANKTCPPSVDFYLVDAASDEGCIKQLRARCNSIHTRNIRICETHARTSLAEAWNLGLMLTKSRYAIFASSDVVFVKQGWYEALERLFGVGCKYVLIENHAVFGMDKQIIPKVGWFDEEFVPGPHFDTDYLIRVTEAGIEVQIVQNNYYEHGDDDLIDRTKGDIPNRLPMNDFTNERVFIDKWESSWLGWEKYTKEGSEERPHPPNQIGQTKRKRDEIDPHPLYRKKLWI